MSGSGPQDAAAAQVLVYSTPLKYGGKHVENYSSEREELLIPDLF